MTTPTRTPQWVYVRSEPGLYTVGFYSPDGEWYTDSDHGSKEDAGNRVAQLNGQRLDNLNDLLRKALILLRYPDPNVAGAVELIAKATNAD